MLLRQCWFILELKRNCLLNQNKHTVLTTEKAFNIFPNLSMKSHKYKVSEQQFELVEETLQSNKSGPRYQPLTCLPSFTKVMKTLSPLLLWFPQLSIFFYFPMHSFWENRNGILLPKLFWPTVRKNCSSDREKLLKFEAEGRELQNFLRSLEQFTNSERSEQFLVTECFFNFFLEVSQI